MRVLQNNITGNYKITVTEKLYLHMNSYFDNQEKKLLP